MENYKLEVMMLAMVISVLFFVAYIFHESIEARKVCVEKTQKVLECQNLY